MYGGATTTYVDRMTNAYEDAARLRKAIKVADVIWDAVVTSGSFDAAWLVTNIPLTVNDDYYWDAVAERAGTRKLSRETRLAVVQLLLTRAHPEISRHPSPRSSAGPDATVITLRRSDDVEVRRLQDGAVQFMSMRLVDERASQALSWRDRRGRHVVPAVTIVHSDGAQYQYRRAQ